MYREVYLIFILIGLSLTNPLKNDNVKNEIKEEKDTPPDYRLDDKVLPIHYDLHLTPYLKEAKALNKTEFTFDGHVVITLKPTQDVNKIVLHAKNLKIDKNLIIIKDEKANKSIPVTDMTNDNVTDKLTLTLEKNLTKNQEYKLNFTHFLGRMDDDMHGFYRSYHTLENGEKVWIGSTQFQPVHARRAFPCFDEPQFKATFQVTINHTSQFKAISNTNAESIKKIENDRTLTVFKKTPKMSTYLLAFLVSDFEINGGKPDEFGVIARKAAKNQTQYALEVGQKLLEKLDNFTGKPYKDLGNPKMHLAAIPDFSAGAMENWGLLTFRERALLYDNRSTTASAKESIATVIAHEQAHMWFGDYVTCAWWNVTWLNEGFARYFQYFTTHEVHPDWELDKQFVIKQIQSVFVSDSLNDAHPLTNPKTNSPTDVGVMFDTITYNKGASIIRMISHMMGQDKFKKAIQTYFKTEKIILNTALPEDLFKAFKSEFDEKIVNLTEIQKDWTEQVGYPVVTVTLSDDRKQFKISQKRFVLNENVTQQDLKYTIPITFATNKKNDFTNTTPDFYLLKNENETTKNLTDVIEWIVVNKLQTGYYRVNYDEKTWHLIHNALGKESFSGIPEENRAQIIDDMFNFGRSGLIDYKELTHLNEYLKKEESYLPWYATLTGFNFIANRLEWNHYTLLQKHIKTLLSNSYKSLGFSDSANDKHPNIHNRAQILEWACKIDHEDCVRNAIKYFTSLKTKNESVPVNVRSIVYCTALREGDMDEFDYMWKRYKNENVATEQVLILSILGCSKSKDTIEKYLNFILSDEVRSQDKSSALSSAYSSNKNNSQIVFDHIKSKLDNYTKILGVSETASLISNVASRFTTDNQVTELEKFLEKEKGKFGDSAKTIEKAINTVKDNLSWRKKRLSKFVDYLQVTYGAASIKTVSLVLLGIMSVIVLFLQH